MPLTPSQAEIERLVFEALGAASACWKPDTGSAVFDAERCKEIGYHLIRSLGLTSSPDKSRQALADVVAYVPIHPRLGPLWQETIAAGQDASECRPRAYPMMVLYASPSVPDGDIPPLPEPYFGLARRDGGQDKAGPWYTSDQIRERDAMWAAKLAAARALISKADNLLGMAGLAMQRLGLSGKGSDCRLSHEVRMFALRFSDESRDGPGELQVNGTGDLLTWRRAAHVFLAAAPHASQPVADIQRDAWQPIETAPKDGQHFFAWRAHSTRGCIVKWDSQYGEYQDEYGDHIYHLTYWMPLPPPPALSPAPQQEQ